MFCQNCGKSEQTPGSHCRSCGEFLTDSASNLNLVYKFLGINTIEKQVNANLLINAICLLMTGTLFIFLQGYYDAAANKIPAIETPTIIYFVYAFLIFISIWQFISLALGLNMKSKFSGQNIEEQRAALNPPENEIPAPKRQASLPQADLKNFVPASVTENTTRHLAEKVKRSSSQTEHQPD
jgi:hypothetical protein